VLDRQPYNNLMRQPINEEEKRRKRIIDFISVHQGCIAEDLVEGVKDYIGRGKVFKILPDLKDERIVREERGKPNSREIKLFVDEDNPLVSVPKDLNEFHQTFMTFLQRITEGSTPFISSLASELSLYFEDFKKERGKKQHEKLKNDEIKLVFDRIESDEEGSMDLGELDFHLSKFVKAIGILGKFIQICMALSILVWRPEIKDKDSFNKLLSIVYNEISNMQIETIHVINNAFHHVEHNIPVVIKGKVLTEALNERYDLEESLNIINRFGLHWKMRLNL
jgi:hypothetical protein